MKTITAVLFTAVFAGGLSSSAPGQTEAESRPVLRQHVGGLFGGSVKSDGKTAATYGLAYTYRLHPSFGLGAYYQWSSGDYDAEGGGVQTAIALPENFSLLAALGVEHRLFDDNELLLRVGASYSLDAGRVTFAPAAWLDFVNGKQILFAGLTAGVGF